MRRLTFTLLLLFPSLLFFAPSYRVAAQTNPTMTEQRRDAGRDSLFGEFTEHKRIATSEQQRLAYEVAKQYLQLFGGEENADTRAVRKFVIEYERFLHDVDIDTAYRAKKYAKAFELGRTSLKKDPNDFFALATLVKAGFDQAQSGDSTLNSETATYAGSAIKLLESDSNLKPRPFQTTGMATGYLNFALGWFLKDQAPSEAAPAFVKAIQADSPYKNDPAIYRLLGVCILKGDFTKLSTEYNEKFGSKPPSAEQTAMLEKINHLADRAIDAYARAVALTEQQDAKAKMLAQLTALYKNFHNNSDAGLNELVTNVLSKPFPSM